MITYTEGKNGRVTLEMSQRDYAALLLILGMALGPAEGETARSMIIFINDLNRTNPNYRPYKVPE